MSLTRKLDQLLQCQTGFIAKHHQTNLRIEVERVYIKTKQYSEICIGCF
jgi:hypothetical protein